MKTVLLARITSAPAPVVSSVLDSVVDIDGGGRTQKIYGSNFISGCTATIGGNSALSLTFVSPTELQCTMPSHAVGFTDVVVSNPDLKTSGTSGNGLIRYWHPGLVTAAARFLDARKNVAVSGANVTSITDIVAGAVYTRVSALGTVVRTPSAFSTGATGLTHSGLGRLQSAWFNNNQGTSVFWVSKHTATGATPAYAGNVPMTIMGDSTGSVDHNCGFDAGQLAYVQYNGAAWNAVRKAGAGLNDGNARLHGWTHEKFGNGSALKAWIDTTQQGATFTGDPYQDSANGFDSIGMGYQSTDAAFQGTWGCFLDVNGIISAGDQDLLTKWARQSFNTV